MQGRRVGRGPGHQTCGVGQQPSPLQPPRRLRAVRRGGSRARVLRFAWPGGPSSALARAAVRSPSTVDSGQRGEQVLADEHRFLVAGECGEPRRRDVARRRSGRWSAPFDLGVHHRRAGPAGAGRASQSRQPGDALVEACEVVDRAANRTRTSSPTFSAQAVTPASARSAASRSWFASANRPRSQATTAPRVSRRAFARIRRAVGRRYPGGQGILDPAGGSQASAYAPASSSRARWRPRRRARSRPAPAFAQASSPARRARSAAGRHGEHVQGTGRIDLITGGANMSGEQSHVIGRRRSTALGELGVQLPLHDERQHVVGHLGKHRVHHPVGQVA